jgi:hypothetical protein
MQALVVYWGCAKREERMVVPVVWSGTKSGQKPHSEAAFLSFIFSLETSGMM